MGGPPFPSATHCIEHIFVSQAPTHGSGSSISGVGAVFVLGMGVLGLALMLFTRVAHPAFFRGETLPRITSSNDHQQPLTD